MEEVIHFFGQGHDLVAGADFEFPRMAWEDAIPVDNVSEVGNDELVEDIVLEMVFFDIYDCVADALEGIEAGLGVICR